MPDTDDIVTDRGQLVARGALVRALTDQLASTQRPDAAVRVGLTFVSTGGEYCRTFTLERGAAAGLACRSGGEWRIELVARAAPKSTEYRMAAGDLPAVVQQAVAAQIQGDSLGAAAEQAARQRGWKR